MVKHRADEDEHLYADLDTSRLPKPSSLTLVPTPELVTAPTATVAATEAVLDRVEAAPVAAVGMTRRKPRLARDSDSLVPRRDVSLRGGRRINLKWSAEEDRFVTAEHYRLQMLYVAGKQEVSPGSKWGLTRSHLTGHALTRALKRPNAWAKPGVIRNHGSRITGPKDQAANEMTHLINVTFLWPETLLTQLDALQLKLSQRSANTWGPRFTLTLSNIAVAGILHELKTVDEWYLDVPNDDRFLVPLNKDGRIRRGTSKA